MPGVEARGFDTPDETRTPDKTKVDVVRMAGTTAARFTFEPGWKWSSHVGPQVGASRCNVEHVGMVLSGVATAALDDGRVFELREGSLFFIPAVPHDSWVVGDRPYVSLHFMGADQYAKKVPPPLEKQGDR